MAERKYISGEQLDNLVVACTEIFEKHLEKKQPFKVNEHYEHELLCVEFARELKRKGVAVDRTFDDFWSELLEDGIKRREFMEHDRHIYSGEFGRLYGETEMTDAVFVHIIDECTHAFRKHCSPHALEHVKEQRVLERVFRGAVTLLGKRITGEARTPYSYDRCKEANRETRASP